MMTTVDTVYRPRHGLTGAVVEIFEQARYAILGTENPDGSVHMVPVMFRQDAGRISIQTGQSTRKVRNVERCGRATVLVQDPRVNGEAWASGSGLAEVVHGEEAQRIGRHVRGRYLTDRGEAELGTVLARYDDTSIVVTPISWMTWNTAAYNAALAERGVDFERSDRWFR